MQKLKNIFPIEKIELAVLKSAEPLQYGMVYGGIKAFTFFVTLIGTRVALILC